MFKCLNKQDFKYIHLKKYHNNFKIHIFKNVKI